MLNKRTNILFDDKLWQNLNEKARVDKTSIGELVRKAVTKAYFTGQEINTIKATVDNIKKIRKTFKGHLDYKELINYGRKH